MIISIDLLCLTHGKRVKYSCAEQKTIIDIIGQFSRHPLRGFAAHGHNIAANGPTERLRSARVDLG